MNEVALDLKPACAEIAFRGETLLVDPRGCLIWPSERLLVVSDLHLEKGSSFAAKRRAFLPPYDTKATLENLSECIAYWQPETVISLGDSFHDEEASVRLPQVFRNQINEMIKGRNWIWIYGNHDPSPPKNLGGEFSTMIQIGPLNFTHEPLREFHKGEIAGHLHPCAKIRQRGKSVRRRCVAGDEKRLILPAFGAFTGGLNIRDAAFDGLFDTKHLQAWLISAQNVFRVSGNKLVK